VLIARLGMRREVALYCELNAPLISRRVDAEYPDYNITQHTSTGRRYPSSHAFYSSVHGTNTRKSRGKDSNLTDCPSGGEM
jgi:hypothetical protein